MSFELSDLCCIPSAHAQCVKLYVVKLCVVKLYVVDFSSFCSGLSVCSVCCYLRPVDITKSYVQRKLSVVAVLPDDNMLLGWRERGHIRW